LAGIGATGIGAANFPLIRETISDLVCTARGIHRFFPSARTVIDVAGQSTKSIRIGAEGQVVNFAQSERCASGSGRFLEVIAKVLRVELEEFGPLSLRSRTPIAFSTSCAVFGESEAVTRVAAAVPPEDIAAGVNRSLADKIASLVKKIKLEKPCALCGGGALNIGLVKEVEERLDLSLLVPEQPQVVAALGAAVAVGNSLQQKTS
jgi:predicted CoA-substrate-specific enzyme activase